MARASQSSLPIVIKINVIRRLQSKIWSLLVTALLAWVRIIQIELEPNLCTQTESERFSSAHFEPGSTTLIDLELLWQTRFMCPVQKPQHNVLFATYLILECTEATLAAPDSCREFKTTLVIIINEPKVFHSITRLNACF